ncbi:MAG TPA: hypothetical protein ENG03_08155 [Thioploca sp.]|nr:MAG: hypothetical protein B6247_16860 [Beggiatoa sp. 4572_84]RKZ61566.1 MAG: hypothetical protein DRR08_08390 [Gammaproteobacteria bacterium]HDN27050.1 hypothetical protein [Thioploca sp.]
MISYQLSVISYQLSVISYQCSVISYQCFVISYQCSVNSRPNLNLESNVRLRALFPFWGNYFFFEPYFYFLIFKVIH